MPNKKIITIHIYVGPGQALCGDRLDYVSGNKPNCKECLIEHKYILSRRATGIRNN